ncbi:MAG TPA: pyridoxal-dependent decarboxylase, partial [Acidobacteriota bacterium]
DDTYRLPVENLANRITEDRRAGKNPFCVVANAGTTNTGAVDPLTEMAGLCRQEGLWFHIDGAFGAAAVLSEKGRALLSGLEQADSLVIDPHKWLFQPYEIGCVLLRQREHLRRTFRLVPEYLKDVESKEDEINFCDYGIQLSRSFRAFKLWASLKTFGVRNFRNAVEWGISLAELAERRLRRSTYWQITSPARLATLTFRYVPPGVAPTSLDDYTTRLVDRIVEEGFMMMTSTALRGRKVLRMCTMNPRTTEQDILDAIDHLERLAKELANG